MSNFAMPIFNDFKESDEVLGWMHPMREGGMLVQFIEPMPKELIGDIFGAISFEFLKSDVRSVTEMKIRSWNLSPRRGPMKTKELYEAPLDQVIFTNDKNEVVGKITNIGE